MKVVCLRGGFGFEKLALEEQPEPECGPSEVKIRVRAVSLNYRDVMMVRGEYNPRQKLPLVPCSDAVGEVVEVGSGVTGVALGERVCPTFAPRWLSGPPTRAVIKATLGGPEHGTLSEFMTLDAEALVRPPPHLDDLEAACLACAGLTAFRAVVALGEAAPGHTLVCMGSGGVSLFGLSFGKACGARVVLLSRSADKLERARALGPELCIDTSQVPAWGAAVRAFTGGEGADHVLDVGGATLPESLRALRPGGMVSVIGVLGGAQAPLDVRPILMQNLRVQGVFVGDRQSFRSMVALIAEKQLRPVLDRCYPLEQARAAFEYAASGAQFGKVCVRLSS